MILIFQDPNQPEITSTITNTSEVMSGEIVTFNVDIVTKPRSINRYTLAASFITTNSSGLLIESR